MKKIIVLVLILCTAISFAGCTKTCEVCDGEGIVQCTVCNNGVVQCDNCSGEGTVTCDNCKEGKSVCEDCNGTGKTSCEACHQKGVVTVEEKCPQCADSKKPGYEAKASKMLQDMWEGKLYDTDDEKYWEECTNCEGSGRVTVEKPCTDCDGSGFTSNCDTCDGTGEVECPECGGTQIVDCPNCDEGLKVCPNCKGKLQVECDECSGTGRVDR